LVTVAAPKPTSVKSLTKNALPGVTGEEREFHFLVPVASALMTGTFECNVTLA